MFNNPVYNRSFADPFVLKFCGAYWAYATGFAEDGRVFPVLHSTDLVHWNEHPGAMGPLPGAPPFYWAPEVAYFNGRFYLYYSAGNEALMEIRVAVAERPGGPFIDSGHRLTREEFAIDAHPFEDDDGNHYLFYATDFLNHAFIGTGTVCDRMLDPFTLAGEPRPVTRARFDWQVYDPARQSKGGVRWHTVEGPFVLKRKGIYYEMFSGGNWQNITYGVSYAVSDRIVTDEEWPQASDGERVLPILRTLPGKVIGPGHNSVVRGPNNRELFCIYHRWTQERSARVLSIDRLDWAGDRMLVLGPSTAPQPMPLCPTHEGFLEKGMGDGWSFLAGSWIFHDDAAVQESVDVIADARCSVASPSFLMEVWLRQLENPMGTGSFGISMSGAEDRYFRVMLAPETLIISWQSEAGIEEELIALPYGFDLEAFHRLRIEVDGRRIALMLDGPGVRWEGRCDIEANEVALVTCQMAAAFAGFELTLGWEDLFMIDGDPTLQGWECQSEHGGERGDDGVWYIEGRELRAMGSASPSAIVKGGWHGSYELVVNARVLEPGIGSGYGIYPAFGWNGSGPNIRLEVRERSCILVAIDSSGSRTFILPEGFDPAIHQQFRFRKEGGRLLIYSEAGLLGEFPVSPEPARVGLYAHRAPVAFDMVRLTVIEPRRRSGE